MGDPTTEARPNALRAATARALADASDVDAALDRLVAALVPALVDAVELELVDEATEVARRRRTAGTPLPSSLDLGTVDARRAPSLQMLEEADGVAAVACVRDGDDVMGTLVLATRGAARPLVAGDLAALDDAARLLGTVVGRSLLQRRAREAARRSQRIASQLHQLLAASISVAGLQREGDVLDALASRARGVFDADEAIVTLDHGHGAPRQVVARRPSTTGAPDADVPALAVPPALRASDGPVRDAEWLVAPLAGHRREPQGAVAIHRRQGATFSDDDVEVASLLAQTASSALEATELHRTIVGSEERLRVLVDTAPIGIVETDLDGAIEWWNRAAGALFEWPDVEVAGTTPTFPEDTLTPLRELWGAAVQGELVAAHDLSGVELGGRRRELAASVALVAPTEGRRGSLLTVVEDVTDHRQLMEELRHAQRMDVIGQLSSSVAHDFNNLLTLIAGYAELLVLESRGSDRTTQLARDIQTTTTRASTLTGKLLTMGRTKLPAPVVFSPVGSVRELSEVLDRILGEDVDLELTLDTAAGTIRADPDQFEQMVMNLATNARDAMDEGGQLRISITPRALDAATAASLGLTPGDYVEVVLADDGAGMDDETLARCFEPLFTTKGPSKGTGLGLPAARRVVMESGGAIDVQSSPGEGTTFNILFPVVIAESTSAPADDAPAPVVPGDGATVLLAEDEGGIRELIARILRHNGFEVLEAESGEHALEVAAHHDGTIHLLVSDVVLGGMTGEALACVLQSQRPELLVVLVSGNVDSTVVESVEPGTGVFLAKPFRPSELVGVISELRVRREESNARP
jgi:PAS domain S-box-containing protein